MLKYRKSTAAITFSSVINSSDFKICLVHNGTWQLSETSGLYYQHIMIIIWRSSWVTPVLYILSRSVIDNSRVVSEWGHNLEHHLEQGILKVEVSLYGWPPVWLVWNQLHDNWQFFVFICKTGKSKQVKQEVNGTVILSPLVFPAYSHQLCS